MTKKIHIILFIAAICLAGCNTYLPVQDFAFLVKEAPLVPCNELTQDCETTNWKGQPFTGRTVRYKLGFELALYQNGKRVSEDKLSQYWLPHWMPDEKKQPEYYRVAFREYARSDWGFAHDEYILCCQEGYGEIEDVPKLIKGLEYWGDVEPGDNAVCSRCHCLKALEFVTGAKAGLNASDWKKWWKEYQEKTIKKE